MVPCGRPDDHKEWIDSGYSCPYCTAKFRTESDRRDRDIELEKLADLIVEKLLSRINPE